MGKSTALTTLLKSIGPGLLFAGAAIGVSHLVQSTRAGAMFGLGLIGVVLVANLTKYPGLSFGSRYTNATGHSLLEGYRRQGRWTLVVFSVLTLGTMFTVAAAVTLVTAAIFNHLLLAFVAYLDQPSLSAMAGHMTLQVGAVALFIVVGVLLKTGGFGLLDRLIKVLLGTMAAMTLVATVMVLPDLDWGTFSLWLPPGVTEAAAIAFVVALAGWMPAPMDISVWSSLWALAKRDQTGHTPSPSETRVDFNLGFFLCVVLAICFVILGCVVMHQPGVEPAKGGIGMAKQILGLFTGTLGDWSLPVVGAASLAVMFSTTLTVMDAFPRVLVVLVDRLRGPESGQSAVQDFSRRGSYWIGFAVVVAGAIIMIQFFLKSLAQMVDLATTLSFVTTPILAWFNHRAMHSDDVDPAYRPSRAMTVFSWICLALLAAFALFYLWHRFLRGG